MVGDLIIDGQDIYTNFMVGVAHEGLNGLVQFQSLKPPPFNEWPEYSGIEVDLSDPKLENKTFIMKFYGHRDISVRNFIDFLDEQTYHVFEFPKLGITRTLRFTKMNSRRTINEEKAFELEFADDSYPFDNYIRPSLIPIDKYYNNKVTIDGIPLSDYGIYHTYGMHDKVLVVGDVKNALTINEPSINSVIYDSGAVIVYSNRDISIDLTLTASPDIFWNNWFAFFYDLTRPGERSFYYDARGDYWDIFYKSCSIKRFECAGNGEIWCDFNITLTFSNMQLTDMWNVLATGTKYGDVILDNTGRYIDTTINGRNPS